MALKNFFQIKDSLAKSELSQKTLQIHHEKKLPHTQRVTTTLNGGTTVIPTLTPPL